MASWRILKPIPAASFSRALEKSAYLGSESNGGSQYVGALDRLKVSSGILTPKQLDYPAGGAVPQVIASGSVDGGVGSHLRYTRGSHNGNQPGQLYRKRNNGVKRKLFLKANMWRWPSLVPLVPASMSSLKESKT